jgi:hypothetical protein
MYNSRFYGRLSVEIIPKIVAKFTLDISTALLILNYTHTVLPFHAMKRVREAKE